MHLYSNLFRADPRGPAAAEPIVRVRAGLLACLTLGCVAACGNHVEPQEQEVAESPQLVDFDACERTTASGARTQLATGTEGGLFRLHIEGRAAFDGPSAPAEAILATTWDSDGVQVARAPVGSGGRWSLRAQVSPGSWMVRTETPGGEYWTALGPRLFVSLDGVLRCQSNCRCEAIVPHELRPGNAPPEHLSPASPTALGWAGLAVSFTRSHPKITSLTPGRAGVRAGLEPGDALLSLGGRRVGDFAALKEALEAVPAGASVQIVIERNHATIPFDLVHSKREEGKE